MKIIVKTLFFEDLERCVRERKRYQQIIKNDSKSIKQTSKNSETINRTFGVNKSIQIGSRSAQWSKQWSWGRFADKGSLNEIKK